MRQTVFVNESLETMLLLLCAANIYANASDILKNKKKIFSQGGLVYWQVEIFEMSALANLRRPQAL